MPPRSHKPRIPQVPLELWRPLYAAADELRALALWKELGDRELLGIDHPKTGEPLLGIVMGGLGRVFGLSLHHGEAGVRFALEAGLDSDEEPEMEEFYSISVMKVEFMAKRDLPPEEKRRLNGMNFRPAPMRPLLWPSLQSIHPGCIPWHLELSEAELLLHTLPRVIGLGACLLELLTKGESLPEEEVAFWPRHREPDEPLRPKEIEWRRLRVPPRDRAPVAVEVASAAALKELPQAPAFVLELDATTGVMGIIDEGERPWLVKMGIAAEAEGGMVLATETGEAPDEPIEAVAGRAFVKALYRAKARPIVARVRQVRIQTVLEEICARLEIGLELRHELPAVEEFQAATARHFGG